MKGIFKRIASGIAALAMIFSITASAFVGAERVSVYAETAASFDDTNVTSDLKDSTIAGKKFDLSDFSTLTTENMSVYAFTEFGYAVNGDQSGYGLYVYVLNPMKKSIITTSPRNRINISFGNTDDYSTYPLTFLNYSLDKGFERLFYKFKVELTESQKNDVLKCAVVDQTRVYKVQGVDICVEKEGVSDYQIGGIYTFTGYAKGYGSTSEATLSCKVIPLETIAIEVNHTTYRTAEEYKDYTKQALSSFYFSIPEKYFEAYPNGVESIKASWYEYKTTPIFVTSDENAQEAFEPYLGIEIGEKESALNWRVMWEEKYKYVPSGDPNVFGVKLYEYGRTYNRLENDYFITAKSEKYDWAKADCVKSMNWFFYTGKVSSVADYKISGARLEAYAKAQSAKYADREQVVDGYAAYLFEDSIDENRVELLRDPSAKRGYMEQEIFADAGGNLLVEEKLSKWEKFIGKKAGTETGFTYQPIVELSKDSQYMAKEAFANEYLTDEDDHEAINAFIKSTYEKTGDAAARPYLLRFAVTDYYVSKARFDSLNNDSMSEIDGYVAQETVFLNAQVIHIAFKGAEGRVVIPVACDPIDVIPGLDPPNGMTVTNNSGGCEQTVRNVLSILIIALAVYLIVKFILALIKRLAGD